MTIRPDPDLGRPDGATATIELVIRAHTRDLGGFSVRRALPGPRRRLVGPFIFWDHMGPTTFDGGHGVDVRPHPHIGLATVTYLFDGEIVHKDTLGSDQAIRPGAVNWMTAGRGIAHSERTGPNLRRHGSRLHGIQSWVALPHADEGTEPSFTHHPASTIPETSQDGVRVRVIAGTAFGVTSPVRVFSPMLYAEAVMPPGAFLVLPNDHEERAAYVVEGSIACDGQTLSEGDMLIATRGAQVTFKSGPTSRVMLLGGAPMDGPRLIWWNFVASSQERMEHAKADWKEGRFGKIPGDDLEFIPLPDR